MSVSAYKVSYKPIGITYEAANALERNLEPYATAEGTAYFYIESERIADMMEYLEEMVEDGDEKAREEYEALRQWLKQFSQQELNDGFDVQIGW